jgi:hypothetical protein
MRVSPGRAGGFKSCAAQSGRVESLTRPQSFGHLKVADPATAFPRANPQLPSVGPLTPSIRLPTNQATFPRTRQRGALYGLPFYVRGGDLEIGDVLKVIARTERRWGSPEKMHEPHAQRCVPNRSAHAGRPDRSTRIEKASGLKTIHNGHLIVIFHAQTSQEAPRGS